MSEERIIRSGCVHNCPGRCVLKAHVRNGVIVRISSDDEGQDRPERRQLRACARGLAYRKRVYHPDRLRHPLIRTGERGSGQFRQASWEEALTMAAEGIRGVRERHGNDSLFVHYGSGHQGLLSGELLARRLLGLYGGFLGYYGDYSAGATAQATRATYGTVATGNSYDDLINARLIILWGANLATTHIGTGAPWYLAQAKSAGAHIVYIDPIYTETAALADEWVPIYPGTDNALADAMAYLMTTEELLDKAFVDSHCSGFDERHLPAGAPAGSSYESYLMGSLDQQAKTPEWAEAITGVPAATIKRLARAYGTIKPAALIQGYGPQRAAEGEQAARGAMVLAAITGNVGIRGGGAAGCGVCGGRLPLALMPYSNPVKASIPVFRWTDAIVRGTEMGQADGVRGVDRLKSDIKLILNFQGNTLVNQHGDVNRTTAILRDQSRVEFILVAEQFLTPSARFADVVFPATTWLERDDVASGEQSGEYALFLNKAIEPLGEARSDYWAISEIAHRLGIGNSFSEGKSEEGWLRELVAHSGIADYEEFKRNGIYRRASHGPYIAFGDFRRDPDTHPLRTASGKIEVYSSVAASLKDSQVSPIPRYARSPEGRHSQSSQVYPLQLVTPHARQRTHSTLSNVPWLKETARDGVMMNPADAATRQIADGDMVRVWNDRGALVLPAELTERIMPGVVAIYQGRWYEPQADGVDAGGCANMLTSHRPTAWANATTQHTALVEIRREQERKEA